MSENHQLSDRELEILQQVATGASNKDIANELVISVNTVKVHLRNIYHKLGVSSRTEATIAAVRMGIVQPEVDDAYIGEIHDRETEAKTSLFEKARWLVPLIVIFFIFAALALIFGIRSQFPIEVTAPENAQFEDESRWQEQVRMSIPRKGFAGTVYDDQIFIFGGETKDGITNLVERYNPENDSWETLASKITPVSDIRAAAIGGLIYIPGGRLATGDVSNKLEIYDPIEDKWINGSPLPESLSAYALAAFEGKLYLFGGWNGDEYVSNVFSYDPSNDLWEQKTSMPTARGYAGAGVAGGKIFVFGGTDGEILDINEAYQPAMDDGTGTPWERMSPLPEKRYAMGSASVAEIIHVVGGGENPQRDNLGWKYFPQNDQWEEFLIPAGNPWKYLEVVPLGTLIIALGGEIEGNLSDRNASYKAIYTITIPVIR